MAAAQATMREQMGTLKITVDATTHMTSAIRHSQIEHSKRESERTVIMQGHPTETSIKRLEHVEQRRRVETAPCLFPAEERVLKNNIMYLVSEAQIEKGTSNK